MSEYIKNNLVEDEKILFTAKVSKGSQLGLYILGVIFLPLYDLGIIFFIIAYIQLISTEIAISDKRIIAKFGFIKRQTVELLLKKVESIKVEQDIFGRMLNYGSIVAIGTGGTNTPIPFVSNPLEFRNKLSELIQHN